MSASSFESLTDAGFTEQARRLVMRLTPERIGAVVKQAGISGADSDKYITALLGRRRFLATRFGIAI